MTLLNNGNLESYLTGNLHTEIKDSVLNNIKHKETGIKHINGAVYTELNETVCLVVLNILQKRKALNAYIEGHM